MTSIQIIQIQAVKLSGLSFSHSDSKLGVHSLFNRTRLSWDLQSYNDYVEGFYSILNLIIIAF